MARPYLIDTNAVIDYLDNKLPDKASGLLDTEELEISVITRMELLAWRNASSQQLSILEDFISSVVVRSLNEPVIVQGIEIRKNYRLKLPDAIIAATALVNGFKLVTRNIRDFKNIPNLELINPWEV
jgi:predicted nucleic acid-binding protein